MEVNQAVHLCSVSILCVARSVGSLVLTPKQRSHGKALTSGVTGGLHDGDRWARVR